MDENATLENFDLKLNETAKGFLKETAKWAYFLSILGYIGIGIIVIMALFAGTIFSSLDEMGNGVNPFGGIGGAFITVLYLILGAVYFFPIYYLNKFASNMKTALRENNTDVLTTSLEYLKSHYKFISIMMIIIFALYALILVFVVIAGIAAFAM